MMRWFLFAERLVFLNFFSSISLWPIIGFILGVWGVVFFKLDTKDVVKKILPFFIIWIVMQIILMLSYAGIVSFFLIVQSLCFQWAPFLSFAMAGAGFGLLIRFLCKPRGID